MTVSRPWRSRVSWPMLSSRRAAISVARASPTCELCAHITTRPLRPVRSRWAISWVERVGDVPVAEVPGAGAVREHRAVVLLGVGDHGGVLLGEEVLVLGGDPVAQQVLAGATAQLDELLDHPLAARLADPEQHRLAVGGALARIRLKTFVARTARGSPRPGRAGRGRRSPRASTRPGCRGQGRRSRPCRCSRAAARCGRAASRRSRARRRFATSRSGSGESLRAPPRRRVGARAVDVAVDAVGVGPVALDRDRGEPVLGDQPLGDPRSLSVELWVP